MLNSLVSEESYVPVVAEGEEPESVSEEDGHKTGLPDDEGQKGQLEQVHYDQERIKRIQVHVEAKSPFQFISLKFEKIRLRIKTGDYS